MRQASSTGVNLWEKRQRLISLRKKQSPTLRETFLLQKVEKAYQLGTLITKCSLAISVVICTVIALPLSYGLGIAFVPALGITNGVIVYVTA